MNLLGLNINFLTILQQIKYWLGFSYAELKFLTTCHHKVNYEGNQLTAYFLSMQI